MREIEASAHSIPWQERCMKCLTFSADPHPGSTAWLLAVGMHFNADHHIQLVQK